MNKLTNILALARELVMEAYKNGATLQEIADAHSVSSVTVRNALIEMGVDLHRRGRRTIEGGQRVARRKPRKIKKNIQARLARNLRSRLSVALRGKHKSGSAIRDLDCSIEQLKLWFMYQFQPGMTWDNYGEWHVDHVKPLSSFDLTDQTQLLEACNWYNLQPLWKQDNLKKGAKL